MYVLRAAISHTDSLPEPHDAAALAYYAKTGIWVTISSSAPFGFSHVLDTTIVVGEAASPIEVSQLSSIIAQINNGQDCLRILDNNIITLVIIDGANKCIVALSNIAAFRPCYYHVHNGIWMCATSIRSLAAMGAALRPHADSYREFFVFRYVTPPRTLYDNILRLVPGQCLSYDLTSGISRGKYYAFPPPDTAHLSNDNYCDHIDALLRNRIGEIIAGSAKPAILLSGGLDSSLLACMAIKAAPHVRSLSSGFSFLDPSERETEYALSMAQHIGVTHYTHYVSPEEYLRALVDSIYYAEEPVHHLQSALLYMLYKHHVCQRYDVLICGEGADGIFGNSTHVRIYRHRRIIATMRYTGAYIPYRFMLRLLGIQKGRWRFYAADFAQHSDSNEHILWLDSQYTPTRLVRRFFGGTDDDILYWHKAIMLPYREESLLTRETIYSLLNECFVTAVIWGQMGCSQGVAVQYPFITKDLIEYLVGIPWDIKLREPKYFIRQLLRQQGVPEHFITRRKISFGVSADYWALPGTLLQPLVDMAEAVYDRRLLRSLQSVESGRAMLLWNIINLHLWTQLLIDKRAPDDLSGEIIDRYRVLQKGIRSYADTDNR